MSLEELKQDLELPKHYKESIFKKLGHFKKFRKKLGKTRKKYNKQKTMIIAIVNECIDIPSKK